MMPTKHVLLLADTAIASLKLWQDPYGLRAFRKRIKAWLSHWTTRTR